METEAPPMVNQIKFYQEWIQEKILCCLRRKILLFAEQADSGLEDSQWSTKFMDSIL